MGVSSAKGSHLRKVSWRKSWKMWKSHRCRTIQRLGFLHQDALPRLCHLGVSINGGIPIYHPLWTNSILIVLSSIYDGKYHYWWFILIVFSIINHPAFLGYLHDFGSEHFAFSWMSSCSCRKSPGRFILSVGTSIVFLSLLIHVYLLSSSVCSSMCPSSSWPLLPLS